MGRVLLQGQDAESSGARRATLVATWQSAMAAVGDRRNPTALAAHQYP